MVNTEVKRSRTNFVTSIIEDARTAEMWNLLHYRLCYIHCRLYVSDLVLSTCCGITFTGFASHSASSSSCVCWHTRRSMVWHRRISPISADQSHQLAADRDSDPPLVATSWSAPPPCTSAPVHSLWRAQRHETSSSAFTGTRDSWPRQDGIKDLSSLHPVTVPNCLTCCTLVMTLFILRRIRNCRRCYYYISVNCFDCNSCMLILAPPEDISVLYIDVSTA